jgi:ribosome-associated heat shock protein Hsp15
MKAGRDPQEGPGAPAGERRRLDKWLWFARVVKTRALAARLVEAGHVRLNGTRAAGPAKPVRPGDVLTIALERQVRVLRVRGAGERRGPYEEARLLYDDLTAPADSSGPAPGPDAGV